jgi:hypothetical protein
MSKELDPIKRLSPIFAAAAEINQIEAETGANLRVLKRQLREELHRESKKGEQDSSTGPQESNKRR